MKNIPAPNAQPKIIVFANGIPWSHLLLYTPPFKKDWIKRIQDIKNIEYIRAKKQWILPYSQSNIHLLGTIFGDDILFAFKVGQHIGHHQSDQ